MLESKYPNIVDKIRQHELKILSYKISGFSNHYAIDYKPNEVSFVNRILLSNITDRESILTSRLDNHCKNNKNDFAAKIELSKEKAKKNIFDLGVHFFYFDNFYSEDMEKFYKNLDAAKKYHFELGFENINNIENISIILRSLNGLDNVKKNMKNYAFLIANFFNYVDSDKFLQQRTSYASDINDICVENKPDFIDFLIKDFNDKPLPKEFYEDSFFNHVKYVENKKSSEMSNEDLDILSFYAKKANFNIEGYLYTLKQKINPHS